jgi:hypothetical protein
LILPAACRVALGEGAAPRLVPLSVQVVVAPLLVLLSLVVGPKPMDLAFPAGLVLGLFFIPGALNP